MIDAPLAFAFSAGLVAAFNPCGFAMLPAYLSYFVGAEGDAASPSGASGIARALAVGAVVSSGFVVVFGLVGLLVVNVSRSINDVLPWLTVVIGLGLIPLGVAMIRGFEPKLSLPRLQKGGRDRGLGSMFVFGVSYAVVSLSCTLPVFLAATATTFRTSNLISGMAVYLAYALGMGLVLMVLTMALALARGGLVKRLRGVMPHVNRVSGALLAVAGVYVAYYGFFEIWVDRGMNDLTLLGLTITGDTIAWPAERVTGWSSDVQNWVDTFGAMRLGIIIVAAVAGTTAAVHLLATSGQTKGPSGREVTTDS